jgi:hypothetical protein
MGVSIGAIIRYLLNSFMEKTGIYGFFAEIFRRITDWFHNLVPIFRCVSGLTVKYFRRFSRISFL